MSDLGREMQQKSTVSTDRVLGAVLVAGVFSAVGAGMGAVMWGFGINQTGGTFIGLFIAIFIVLMLGWRDLPPPTGGKRAPTAKDHAEAGTTPTPSTTTHSAAPSASGPASSAAAAAAPSSGTAHAPGAGPADPPAAEKVEAAAPDVGRKPSLLDGPRGAPDDLKQIKGVGPALEKLCNSLGVYHFDQIAKWTPDEVAWVDEHLEGFKGRVSRDDWVSQARELAGGSQSA